MLVRVKLLPESVSAPLLLNAISTVLPPILKSIEEVGEAPVPMLWTISASNVD